MCLGGVKQWPNYFTLSLAGQVLHITFIQYLIAFSSRLGASSDVISRKKLLLVTGEW